MACGRRAEHRGDNDLPPEVRGDHHHHIRGNNVVSGLLTARSPRFYFIACLSGKYTLYLCRMVFGLTIPRLMSFVSGLNRLIRDVLVIWSHLLMHFVLVGACMNRPVYSSV